MHQSLRFWEHVQYNPKKSKEAYREVKKSKEKQTQVKNKLGNVKKSHKMNEKQTKVKKSTEK